MKSQGLVCLGLILATACAEEAGGKGGTDPADASQEESSKDASASTGPSVTRSSADVVETQTRDAEHSSSTAGVSNSAEVPTSETSTSGESRATQTSSSATTTHDGTEPNDAGTSAIGSDGTQPDAGGQPSTEQDGGATTTSTGTSGPIVIPWPNDDSSDEFEPGKLPFPVTTGTRIDPTVPAEPAEEFETKGNKVDLLFVVDNSMSMTDKQAMLRAAVPTLIEQLLSASCRDADGNRVPAEENGDCPEESALTPTSVEDLHVAVITTSLGAYGAHRDCVYDPDVPASEQHVDMAHLLGTLERGASVQAASGSGFLTWNTGENVPELVNNLDALLGSAGEFGCGWEAPLEAMLRFLVDPYPYTRITRQPCVESDMGNNCGRPEVNTDGVPLVDMTLLEQRAQFLRDDSAVSVVMLSDENDCSMRANGQSWVLSETAGRDGLSTLAYRGTAACDDPEYGPNHECCTSCGIAIVRDGCPTAVSAGGGTVALGCEDGTRLDELSDAPNLRCFDQKRRFGFDVLYPIRRYTNALTQELLCPDELGLDYRQCANPVRNPLFGLVDGRRRPASWVTVTGIVGVPWNSLAVDPDAQVPLVYRSTDLGSEDPIEWSWIVADQGDKPLDPLMWEQVEPRSGQSPATGESLQSPTASRGANSINGHEWNIIARDDLQYACVFELPESVNCPSAAEANASWDDGIPTPHCDCTYFWDEDNRNPLCQTSSDNYGYEQYAAKAYPGLRQLEFLRSLGTNATVGSICPKEIDPQQPDYGYRPAFDALVGRLDQSLDD